MKNVIKVRIIYDSAHVAEKEYLRKFFQFIGCLVFEQYIDLGIKKLCSLASDEVLIALNFYREKRLYALWMERQFYLYFDLNDGFVCLSKEKPLPSQYWNQKEENSKRDIRRKALEILIEAIWEGDEVNKKAIKDILECYIPKDGDDDLFLALEEKDLYLPFLDWEITYEQRKDVEFTSMEYYHSSMLELLLSEFTRIEKLLSTLCKGKMFSEKNKEEESPYLVYALINARQLMNYIRIIPKYEMDGRRFENDELIEVLYILRTRYPWFITEFLLRANIYASNGDNYSVRRAAIEYDSFLSIVGSGSPYYRFGIFEDEYAISTWRRLKGDKFLAEKAIQMNQIDPLYYLAYFYIARYYLVYSNIDKQLIERDIEYQKIYLTNKSIVLEQAKAIFEQACNRIKKKLERSDYYSLTYREALYWYVGSRNLASIALLEHGEFSMRAQIGATVCATKSLQNAFLIEDAYGENEECYKKYTSLHYTNEVVYLLYLMLKKWVFAILKDSFLRFVLGKALKEFGEDIPD